MNSIGARLLARLVASLMIAAIAGCTHASTTASGRVNSWTIPGTLRLGEPDEPDNLNPLFGHTSATDQVSGLLFAFLLRYDDNGEYIPDLAREVPTLANGGISRDGTTITLHLRTPVMWSDGAPLTARDWLFTYHAVNNPRNNTKTRYLWDEIASARAPNDATLVIHLKHPNASFLGLLAMGGSGYPPLPAHLLERLPDINRAPFNAAPISSGPFVLASWNRGSSLIFIPNPRYFRGAPPLRRIVWNVIPDTNTLFSKLQAHEIDVYPTVNEAAIARLGDVTGITVSKKLIANWRHLGFNTHKPLLADVRVRVIADCGCHRFSDHVIGSPSMAQSTRPFGSPAGSRPARHFPPLGQADQQTPRLVQDRR